MFVSNNLDFRSTNLFKLLVGGGGVEGDNQVCKTRFVVSIVSNVCNQALNNCPQVLNICTFLFIVNST